MAGNDTRNDYPKGMARSAREIARKANIMANTQPAQITASLVDAGGVRGSVAIPGLIDPAATITQTQTLVTAAGVLLDCMTDCQITDLAITVNAPVTGTKEAPLNSVDVEKTALLTFNNDLDPVRAYGQDIGGVALAILSGPKRINDADTDYGAWVTFMKTAGAHFTPTDASQNALPSIRTNAVTFRKRRRAQKQVSSQAGTPT